MEKDPFSTHSSDAGGAGPLFSSRSSGEGRAGRTPLGAPEGRGRPMRRSEATRNAADVASHASHWCHALDPRLYGAQHGMYEYGYAQTGTKGGGGGTVHG